MKKNAYIILILTLTFLMIVSGCVAKTPVTDTTTAAITTVAATTKEPTETAAVATTAPSSTPVTLEAVVMLPVPATYASLFDGTKIYSDGSRTIILKTLVKGDQVTITGTSGHYGVTAEGSFVNLHLMSVVVTVTPTPSETTAAPTDPTAATTKATTAATTKATTAATTKATTATTTAPAETTAATTAAPTTAPVISLSASEVESIVWSAVIDARNANGFTTNRCDTLSVASQNHASSYTIGHPGKNGTWESCGSLGPKADGTWACILHNSGEAKFATIEECIYASAKDLVTVHVAAMASTGEYTEFGVGVAKQVNMSTPTYYVYISCSSPEDLQWQIDQGWYN